MFRRVWTPIECEPAGGTESKITVYDFGAYYGELVDYEWTCWEICSRSQTEAGEIVEELREMPQDWVPFDLYLGQTYTGTVEKGEMRIRGWSIRTTELERVVDHPLPASVKRVEERAQAERAQAERAHPQTQPPQQPVVVQSLQSSKQAPLRPKQAPQPQQQAPQRQQQAPQRPKQVPKQAPQRQQQALKQAPQPQPQPPRPRLRQQRQPQTPEAPRITVHPKILRGKTSLATSGTTQPSAQQWTPLVHLVQPSQLRK